MKTRLIRILAGTLLTTVTPQPAGEDATEMERPPPRFVPAAPVAIPWKGPTLPDVDWNEEPNCPAPGPTVL